MRKLLIFMLFVGIFVVGFRNCNCNFGNIMGNAFGPELTASGPMQTEMRSNLTNFDKIDIAIDGKLEITIGDAWAVEVSAQQNLLPILKTEIRGNTLNVFYEGRVRTFDQTVIRVTMPKWSGAQLSGSTNLVLKTPLRGGSLDIGVSGSGNIQLPDIQLDKLNVSISGSGEMTAAGTAGTCDLSVSGSGDMMASGLQVGTLDASISGSGNVECTVNDRINAHVSGSGEVRYKGRPVVDSQVSGSGRVKPLD
jgi:hypothetical protein